MNIQQIDRLVAGVPSTIQPRQRQRLMAYAAAARRCTSRIAALRVELGDALCHDCDDDVPLDDSDKVIALLVELDGLERIQPRIDAWLRVSVGAHAEAGQSPLLGDDGPV